MKRESLEFLQQELTEAKSKLDMFLVNYTPRYESIVNKYEMQVRRLEQKIALLKNAKEPETTESNVISDSIIDKSLEQIFFDYEKCVSTMAMDNKPTPTTIGNMKKHIEKIEFRKQIIEKIGKEIQLPKWYQQAKELTENNGSFAENVPEKETESEVMTDMTNVIVADSQ